MAPEQLRGERATPASDQFALAVMAYECLTGSLPFTGDSLGATVYAIMNEKPKVPSASRPSAVAWDVPLMRALSKEQGERYPSVEAFAEVV